MAGGNRQLLLVGFTLVGGALGFYVEEKVEAKPLLCCQGYKVEDDTKTEKGLHFFKESFKVWLGYDGARRLRCNRRCEFHPAPMGCRDEACINPPSVSADVGYYSDPNFACKACMDLARDRNLLSSICKMGLKTGALELLQVP